MQVIKPYRFLPKVEIERQATELIMGVEAKRKRPLTGRYVAEAIADFLDLGVIWETIPPDNQGQIAAMIMPVQREIIINEDIPALKGGFGQSTIAHELGHWILHIDQNAVGKFIDRELDLQTVVEPFLCRSVSTQRGIEWQAQYLASCLLMPVSRLEELLKGRNLTNWNHLYAMRDELGVTISNLTNRLKDLGWISISQDSKQIYPGKKAPDFSLWRKT
ncbi:ImmA/IrrE family metallo-endopeptidase [Limnofasciculus baicalensis]|uniref:ImmA/IrrE family metallo-endopeptidase n=1 Tax=Limnofasciculus baicalensis BBK-W-15 TaxID=2699891 RepID=A0AAE3GPN5_9CYAN|nr:ImmA/IrrE family metallo-endopeptidase [Limnofasciculus baicalensis]MCP2728441.1 ImmA/IrrE family metallo-endopeptidase [Limnofasciculus baicalensis BBK-W-15]